MTQPMLPILIGGSMIAAAVVWWLMGRIAPGGWPQFVLRVGGLAGVVALVGLVGLPALRAQSQNAAAQIETPVIVPVERMTVSTGTLAQTLSATGALAAAEQTTLSFDTSAPVTEVRVKPGDVVKAGDVLAKLDTTDAEARLRDAQIALAEAQASLDALLAPPREIDIKLAEMQIQSAQASLYNASQGPSAADIEIARLQAEKSRNQLWQSQINRDVQLAPNPEFRGANAFAQETRANAQLEQSTINVEIADTNYEATRNEGPNVGQLGSANAGFVSAQAKLEQLLSGPSASDQRKAEIDLETAQLEVDQAQRDLDQTILVAPFDGLVAAENLTAGMMPPAEAVTMIDINRYTIDLGIDEIDVPDVAVGQPVNLTIQAVPDASVSGAITKLDVAPTISGQLVTYKAQVTLDPGDAVLRPGMSTTASVILSQIEDVIVVPNRFIKTDAATRQAAVTVETVPGVYQAVPVTLGLRNTSESQVVGGLQVGQTIVILPEASQANNQNGFGFFRVPGGGPPPGGGNFGGGGGRGGG